jgi:hypothetical protein
MLTILVVVLSAIGPSFACIQPSNCLDSVQSQLTQLHKRLDMAKAYRVAESSSAYQHALSSYRSVELLQGVTDEYHYDSSCQITSINYGVSFLLTDANGAKSRLEVVLDQSLSTVVATTTNFVVETGPNHIIVGSSISQVSNGELLWSTTAGQTSVGLLNRVDYREIIFAGLAVAVTILALALAARSRRVSKFRRE